MPSDFFGLPIELRAYIYELALWDASYQPTATWAHATSYYNPITLSTLLNVGRCISADVRFILKEKLFNNGSFSFDDPLSLHDFRHWLAGQQEDLTKVSFCIRFMSWRTSNVVSL